MINQKGYLHLRKSQSHKSLEAEITLWENMKYFCVLALFPQPSPGRALSSGDAPSSQPGLSWLSLETQEKGNTLATD